MYEERMTSIYRVIEISCLSMSAAIQTGIELSICNGDLLANTIVKVIGARPWRLHARLDAYYLCLYFCGCDDAVCFGIEFGL